MAFLSALPSGGVCAVFTDAQLAKTSEATSNTVVTWSFMAFLNAKFRGAVNPLERRGPTVIHRDRYQSPMQTDQEKIGWDSVYASIRSDRSYFPIESAAGPLPEGLAVRH